MERAPVEGECDADGVLAAESAGAPVVSPVVGGCGCSVRSTRSGRAGCHGICRRAGSTVSGFTSSLLGFVAAIAILVTVHEYGHFQVARRLGVKVLKFSIGFGPALFKWRRRNDPTEYCIGLIPLGGYVKMLDEREGEVEAEEREMAFNRKSLAARSAIVVAGPAYNFLFAIFASPCG